MTSLEQLETQHHVWVVDTKLTDVSIAALRNTLSAWEIERAERFAFEKDRMVYTTAHGALRQLLEHYLQKPASSFEFEFNPYGKPSLVSGNIEFNLTHSGDIALCAFSSQSKIGVDTELVRNDINPEELAHQFFSTREIESLQQANPSELMDLFYRCWTRKEAFVKAHGEGLSIPLDTFSVKIDSNHPSPVECDKTRELCTIQPIDIRKPNYRSALAYFGDIRPVIVCSWNEHFKS